MTNSSTPQVRVLLADDSAIMLRAISNLLASQPEIELVGAVADISEAVRLAGESKPHVVVVDLHLAESAKAEALRLKEERRLLAITAASLDEATLALAADIGADKLLDKMELDEKLIPTILELANSPT
jgi:DNA-binding NarL/FixJ family response regulator